jgi:hypothetical protein
MIGIPRRHPAAVAIATTAARIQQAARPRSSWKNVALTRPSGALNCNGQATASCPFVGMDVLTRRSEG